MTDPNYIRGTMLNSPAEKASAWLGLFATLITLALSVASHFQTVEKSKATQALEQSQQKHEIRLKYLDLALTQKLEAEDKAKIMRLLRMIDDDTTIKAWASQELASVDSYRVYKDSLYRLASRLDSAQSHVSQPAVAVSAESRDTLRRLEQRFASLSAATVQAAQRASVKPTFTEVSTALRESALGFRCQPDSVHSVGDGDKGRPACLGAYQNGSVFQPRREDSGRWRWSLVTVRERKAEDPQGLQPLQVIRCVCSE